MEPGPPTVTDANLARDIGNLEAKVDVLIETVREQGLASEKGRRRLYRTVNRLAERVIKVDARLETVEDEIQAHGQALVDFEKFRADHATEIKIAAAKVEANRTWLKWLGIGFAGMGAIEGDHASGGRLLKWLGSLWSGAK